MENEWTVHEHLSREIMIQPKWGWVRLEGSQRRLVDYVTSVVLVRGCCKTNGSSLDNLYFCPRATFIWDDLVLNHFLPYISLWEGCRKNPRKKYSLLPNPKSEEVACGPLVAHCSMKRSLGANKKELLLWSVFRKN